MSASTRSPAAAEQARCLPGLFSAHGHVSGEIMEADEEGIIVESLSRRRLVVGVIESYQGISQERSELPASLRSLVVRARRFDDFRQIGAHLERSVAVIIKAGGPFASLGRSEEWPWHLKLPKILCKQYQRITHGRSLRHVVQAVGESQYRVKRYEALVIDDGPNSGRQHLSHLLTIRGSLVRACQ